MVAPKKLKVYAIGNLDGRRSALVAAQSKTAACKALAVRGKITKEVDEAPEGSSWHAYGIALALLTPGIPWTKECSYSYLSAKPWTCADPALEAAARVRVRFPAAKCEYDPESDRYEVWVGDYGRPIGYHSTEDLAWADAAKRISVRAPDGLPSNAITVWRIGDAPREFLALSETEGGMRWLAYLPQPVVDQGRYIDWMDFATPFGSTVRRYPVVGGEVRIGEH